MKKNVQTIAILILCIIGVLVIHNNTSLVPEKTLSEKNIIGYEDKDPEFSFEFEIARAIHFKYSENGNLEEGVGIELYPSKDSNVIAVNYITEENWWSTLFIVKIDGQTILSIEQVPKSGAYVTSVSWDDEGELSVTSISHMGNESFESFEVH